MAELKYKAIAAQRWPGYAITGDGSLAVLFHCAHRVELCEMQMLAQVIMSERCGPMCSHIRTPEGGWHEIEKLKLPRAPVLVTVRDWQRD